jgi:hypothetical protein
MVGRGVVTVGPISVHELARLHSRGIRGPLRFVIAIVVWLLITSRIIVEGGGSRKYGMSLVCELRKCRAAGWLYCKFRVQAVRETYVDRERGGQIGDVVSGNRKIRIVW